MLAPMLELRAHVPAAEADGCTKALGELAGVSHIAQVPNEYDGTVRLMADVEPGYADDVFSALESAGVAPDAIGLARSDWIRPASASQAQDASLLWADLVGSARNVSRIAWQYIVLMLVAGTIAGYGVIIDNPILIVGAMAVSPDLLPLTAASVGIVGKRWRLVGRAAVTLFVGFGLATIAAAVITFVLRWLNLIGDVELETGLIPSMTHFGVGTLGVALAAGVAGMVAFETRASAAVGVAISVTTVPAAASAGVALGFADFDRVLSSLVVLSTNVVAIVVAGSATLMVQSSLQSRRARKGQTVRND
jgi:uncharacterized hydrophobic protein (TIGR00271 family)